MTEEEFKMKLGFKKMARKNNEESVFADVELNAPESIDWRTENAVTPVKNQGQCGSCWAFSATGALEGGWAVKHKTLYSLAESQFVDCDTGPDDGEHNQGCNGGDMGLAFEYATANKIVQESDYPYVARDRKCAYDPKENKGVVQASGHKFVTPKDPVAL
jgi:C1A family cysteine protease